MTEDGKDGKQRLAAVHTADLEGCSTQVSREEETVNLAEFASPISAARSASTLQIAMAEDGCGIAFRMSLHLEAAARRRAASEVPAGPGRGLGAGARPACGAGTRKGRGRATVDRDYAISRNAGRPMTISWPTGSSKVSTALSGHIGGEAGPRVVWAHRDLASIYARGRHSGQTDESLARLVADHPGLTVERIHDLMPPLAMVQHPTFRDGLVRAGLPDA